MAPSDAFRAYYAGDREPPPKLYTPDLLGGLCEGCGNPIPAALAGMTMHPCCAEPDFPAWGAACARAIRLRDQETAR